jgi:hypothetical protein
MCGPRNASRILPHGCGRVQLKTERDEYRTREHGGAIQALQQQRGYTVEPMQGLIKDIFELERWWRRGRENKRRVFAAMGVAVQMHQYRAWQASRSTWAIKQEVLGR